MIHNEFREIIILASINELDDFNQHKLKEHIYLCENCREEYERMIEFHNSISNSKPVLIDPRLLEKARRELRLKISSATQKNNLIDYLKSFFYSHKLALGGAGFLLIGIISGILLSKINSLQQSLSAYDLLDQSSVRISNINFIDSDAADGEVTFEFDAVKPVTIRGKISDSHIQQILAHSLLNEKNDGMRLRAITTIASQMQVKNHPGSKIKSALIKTAKYDLNPGVRREALMTLNRLPVDQDIIDMLLFVLENDSNAGNRIAAINSFNPEKIRTDIIDQQALEILKQKTTNDNNEYIKLRAKTVVEEVIKNESL